MKTIVSIEGINYEADLNEPQSLSLGFGPQAENPNAFFINPAVFEPIRVGDFVGSVAMGSGANCEVVTYCAHGNGTHTECLGHITPERIHLPDVLTEFHFSAQVITVELAQENGDWVINESSLQHINWIKAEAIVIRTMPNSVSKKSQIWSGNNPPYFTMGAMQLIVNQGYQHLLTDFPSVDPEEDAGALAAHRIWWNYPQNPRKNATITELIFVPDSVQDGLYLLNIQVPKIHSDAVPSQPVLYGLKQLSDSEN